MHPILRPIPRAPLLTTLRAFSTTPPRPIAKITIVGRLAAEPELTATSSGQEMVRYAVGTSYGPRENRQTNWWRVASFAPEGPARAYLTGLEKGTLVYVEGDCSMRSFENSEGKMQSALSVVQQKIEVLKRPEPKSEASPM
ncbi:MAG: ssDNA binding [Lasallia pustulata]|uniref:ssDNA binding n=1 Tax=Lasallia pustulata TaxID=136370 RepID=A0A1W5DE81_9LECA|nr:MAG: ssDNA binding [Lasallia pustulata]SLM41280.1 ssdna binding [Lasallia pustulata]